MFAHNTSLPGLKMRGQMERERRLAVEAAQMAEYSRRLDEQEEVWENLTPPPEVVALLA